MKAQYYFTDKQLAERFNVSRSTIWYWVRNGNFPNPVKLSDCCTRWTLSDIEKFEGERGAA